MCIKSSKELIALIFFLHTSYNVFVSLGIHDCDADDHLGLKDQDITARKVKIDLGLRNFNLNLLLISTAKPHQ